MIVEVLEHQTDVDNSAACSFFLSDLADANGASSEEQRVYESQVVSLEKTQQLLPNFALPASMDASKCHACTAIGSQTITKGKNCADAQIVRVELCALRLQDIDTDMLITLSLPTKNHEEITPAHSHSHVFKDILKSLVIVNWDIIDTSL